MTSRTAENISSSVTVSGEESNTNNVSSSLLQYTKIANKNYVQILKRKKIYTEPNLLTSLRPIRLIANLFTEKCVNFLRLNRL